MKASKFDAKFDRGENILDALDLSKAKRPMQQQALVSLDIPTWMLDSLDKEAARIGISRQSIIKVWLAERLETVSSHS